MAAIIGLFVILIVSLTAVRIGAVALELTGLSFDVAAFQAQSAFSGAGFTTSESESIVSHSVRRRIIRILILVGNVGLVSTGATLIVALSGFDSENISLRAPVLLGALFLLYLLARSKILYRVMKKMIQKILSRNPSLQLKDYHDLLGISKGYSISRMVVKAGSWQVGRSLQELALQKEGTMVLSISRQVDGMPRFISPTADTRILVEDRLTLYGRNAALDCLFMRPANETGETLHRLRTEQQDLLNQTHVPA